MGRLRASCLLPHWLPAFLSLPSSDSCAGGGLGPARSSELRDVLGTAATCCRGLLTWAACHPSAAPVRVPGPGLRFGDLAVPKGSAAGKRGWERGSKDHPCKTPVTWGCCLSSSIPTMLSVRSEQLNKTGFPTVHAVVLLEGTMNLTGEIQPLVEQLMMVKRMQVQKWCLILVDWGHLLLGTGGSVCVPCSASPPRSSCWRSGRHVLWASSSPQRAQRS